jgi:hypothetical protein
MTVNLLRLLHRLLYAAFFLFLFSACQKEIEQTERLSSTITTGNGTDSLPPTPVSEAILMVIDEESIDNGNAPNNFSETDVNDQLARIGQRKTLRYFRENVGDTIQLYAGEVGDEGWHSLKKIPSSWVGAGPTNNGSRNFLQAGPGLGGGNDGPEVLLDKIPDVTPLRATGLKMLIGKTILAVVYDGDVSTNYSPLEGSLKGSNLGIVALEILQVTKRTDGSSGSLPRVTVRIINADTAVAASLKLFGNPPVPHSSSEPYDITPPASAPAISLINAY